MAVKGIGLAFFMKNKTPLVQRKNFHCSSVLFLFLTMWRPDSQQIEATGQLPRCGKTNPGQRCLEGGAEPGCRGALRNRTRVSKRDGADKTSSRRLEGTVFPPRTERRWRNELPRGADQCLFRAKR